MSNRASADGRPVAKRHLVLSSLAFFVFALKCAATNGGEVIGADGISIDVACKPSSVLPFQVTRLVITLRNTKKVRARVPFDPYCGEHFFGTRSDDLLSYERLDRWIGEGRGRHHTGDTGGIADTRMREQLILMPGESVSISLPVVARWSTRANDSNNGESPGIESVAGSRSMSREIEFKSQLYDGSAAATTKLTVSVPSEADEESFVRLARDRKLAIALFYRGHLADHDDVEKIRAILLELPASTYGDYARFALAKAAVGYLGPELPASCLTDIWLGRISASAVVRQSETMAAQYLNGLKYHPFRSPKKVSAAIDRVLRDRNSAEECADSMSQLQELRKANRVDIANAKYWLEQIDTGSFPYAVDALIMLREIYRYEHSGKADTIANLLNEQFHSHVEWLMVRATEIEYASSGEVLDDEDRLRFCRAQWRELRVR